MQCFISLEWCLIRSCRLEDWTGSMSEGPKVKGHLIITVAEASGKNKDDQLVWDPNFVEGFVKGALKTLSEKALL